MMMARRMRNDTRAGWLGWHQYLLTRKHYQRAAKKRALAEWEDRKLAPRKLERSGETWHLMRAARVALRKLRRLASSARQREARQQAVYASAFTRGLALSRSLKRHPARREEGRHMLRSQPMRRGLFAWRRRHLVRMAARGADQDALRHFLGALARKTWKVWAGVVIAGRLIDGHANAWAKKRAVQRLAEVRSVGR